MPESTPTSRPSRRCARGARRRRGRIRPNLAEVHVPVEPSGEAGIVLYGQRPEPVALDQPAEELVPHAEGLPGKSSGLPDTDDRRRAGDLIGELIERGVRQWADVGLPQADRFAG